MLGGSLGDEREARLLADIAEKGCAPCALTLAGMEDPASVRGWRMDDQHAAYMDIDMTQWPVILGGNNLRAAPMSALGIGALALDGHDPRAEAWLDQAVRNARVVLDFFEPDGTYFEGVSYADYTLRSLFAFLDAHQRTTGFRWADEVNLDGMVRFVLAMQAGRQEDGTPDVVNFSDAHGSTSYCVPAWVARQLGDTPAAHVAQFAVERVSRPGAFHDVLWVDPDRPLAFPPASYHNVRLDNDWVICRTGWAADDAVLAFRSGGPCNHEHADRNSFLFKVYGERLLTDLHGAAYDWRQPKWLLRLTEAHNAVLIDGKGHQYHNGEEGTNASQAEAHVTRFEDDGDRVWFTSDATQAYALVNDDIARVRRTVLFAKPDVIVLLDQIEKDTAPSSVALRFFPDNRDGNATMETDDHTFTIRRPNATLRGWTFARSSLALAADRLDLDEALGVYPYLEVAASPAASHEIVTVLVAQPAGDAAAPTVAVQAEAEGWSIVAGEVRARIGSVDGGALGSVPEVQWL